MSLTPLLEPFRGVWTQGGLHLHSLTEVNYLFHLITQIWHQEAEKILSINSTKTECQCLLYICILYILFWLVSSTSVFDLLFKTEKEKHGLVDQNFKKINSAVSVSEIVCVLSLEQSTNNKNQSLVRSTGFSQVSTSWCRKALGKAAFPLHCWDILHFCNALTFIWKTFRDSFS